MNTLPAPRQTPAARLWLVQPKRGDERVFGALLATVDGHRNVIELESVARALGLEHCAVERLLAQGLIEVDRDSP